MMNNIEMIYHCPKCKHFSFKCSGYSTNVDSVDIGLRCSNCLHRETYSLSWHEIAHIIIGDKKIIDSLIIRDWK